MSTPDPIVSAGSSAEWILQATMTQPMVPFRSEETIDPDLEIDNRSAIDQFIATIENLNILLSRHSKSDTLQEPKTGRATDAAGALESLFAIEPSEDQHETLEAAPDDCVESPDAPTGNAGISGQQGEDEVSLQLNNLVFLGYMSAVESYFRCLVRQLIWADELTAESVEDVKITFGAARHAKQELLPEVLMEEMTFITLDSVKDLLTKIIGIPIGGISDVVKEYDRICQLRHCIVHRFGRLGSKNAMKLGFGSHRTLLEKKIKIRCHQLEALAFNLLNFVKAINNHIYAGVMKRSAERSVEWKWNSDVDRTLFEQMYAVFRQSTSPGASHSPEQAYAIFKGKCEKGSATQVQRAKQSKQAP